MVEPILEWVVRIAAIVAREGRITETNQQSNHQCVLAHLSKLIRSARFTSLGGFRHFDKVAGMDIIDVAIKRDIL